MLGKKIDFLVGMFDKSTFDDHQLELYLWTEKMDGFWSLLKLGANSIALQQIRKSLDCGR